MNRLPSISWLDKISTGDRWQILQVHADETRMIINGLKDGSVSPYRTTRAKALANSRAKLRRIYAAADQFGMNVGQELPA